MTMRRIRRFVTCWQLLHQQRCCQLPQIVAQRQQVASECSGALMVLPKRPFAMPDLRGTVLCWRHWQWALHHLEQAEQIELLDGDWYLDDYPHQIRTKDR